MIIGTTKYNTIHGNPGETRLLPQGLEVELVPATNISGAGRDRYWAQPIPGTESQWPQKTVEWAEDVGCLLDSTDLQDIHER